MMNEPLKRTREGSPFRNATEIGDLFEHLRDEQHSGWEAGRLYALMLVVATTGIPGPAALRLPVAAFDFERRAIDGAALPKPLRHGSRRRHADAQIYEFTVEPLREWSRRCGSAWMFPGKRKDCTWSHTSANAHLDATAIEAGLPRGTTIEIVLRSIYVNSLSSHMDEARAGRRADLRIFGGPPEE